MNPKNNNSKKTSSKKSLSSSKKEIKVDPIFIKGFSRCGGCTNSLNNCVCYENISDDAIEQINDYEEENKRLKKELELLKKNNKDQKKKINNLENELDEKKDNFNYAAYKDERDYEKDYFDLVNKYNILETDYLLLKNKTIDYDYILEENSEMKEELDAWKQKYNEKSEETIKITDALLSNSLKYKWQEVDIKKLEMKIEQQKQTLLKINIMSSL